MKRLSILVIALSLVVVTACSNEATSDKVTEKKKTVKVESMRIVKSTQGTWSLEIPSSWKEDKDLLTDDTELAVSRDDDNVSITGLTEMKSELKDYEGGISLASYQKIVEEFPEDYGVDKLPAFKDIKVNNYPAKLSEFETKESGFTYLNRLYLIEMGDFYLQVLEYGPKSKMEKYNNEANKVMDSIRETPKSAEREKTI
ncbi:hypothetical protein PWEIH_08856 [Listeria weihenstephanensis FSL R9-0317]|uniref:PsbP C-terminal domain-containing protein n=1 Tax=Listeria weihenstephanensis TaxID=1006155 RepID=A0A1S7FT74_9LIST|nr:hypothetical protein [Listeria weihenstephanensis]AQY50600.1 hypothetical protein UE46_05840 [Listeria weihenstephanensis]EUJ38970.1 hypothetical protein PWEIH_08856 [Listeria weihenstephanensis FSL R9-0317]